MPRIYTRTDPEIRFWSHVDKSGDCWLWTARTTPQGYGLFWAGPGSTVYAHRYAYEQTVGPIPDMLMIDHQYPACLKRCVTPDHLRLATRKQNEENRAGAQINSKSGVRGVCWHKKAGKWVAKIKHNGEQHYLGLFVDLAEAERVVVAKRNELFTHNELDRSA